jgi:hypothetical protein
VTFRLHRRRRFRWLPRFSLGAFWREKPDGTVRRAWQWVCLWLGWALEIAGEDERLWE